MTSNGRAALFFGPGKPFRVTELPVPEPEPGALVMRVTRANLCGSDLHIWRGDGSFAGRGRDDGRVVGHEMTGVVHDLGTGVDRDWAGVPLAVGDRIVCQYFAPCGRCRSCLRGRTEACTRSSWVFEGRPSDFPHFRGAFADYFYVHPNMAVFKVPDDVDDALAAGVNCALSQMVMAFERAEVGMGDRVVVQGAGGLGLYATALAREAAAAQIVVIDGVQERLDLARRMGAHEVVDLSAFASPAERASHVKKLTDGGGDVVFELVGDAAAIEEGVRMVAHGGRYVEMGTIYSGTTAALDPGYLVMRNISVQAIAYYDARSLQRALGFLARNAAEIPLAASAEAFALEDIDRAFEVAQEGRVARVSLVMG
jgi:threonine dehydrogenase-like Zn-dependent dehydrogenase